MATAKKEEAAKGAADPSRDDDLDDLDDVLDEFSNNDVGKPAPAPEPEASSSTQASATAATSSANGAAAAAAKTGVEEGDDDDYDEEALNEQFQKELAAGMEALMKGLGGSQQAGGDAGPPPPDGNFNEEELVKQFEQMMAGMGIDEQGEASSSSSTNGKGAGPGPSAGQPANFQDAIRNTMSRLRESDASASSSTGELGGDADLEKLMAALGGAGGEGAEGEEGLAKMLESMMSELMSKDVLYEPLKELRDKYPPYLANPPAAISAEDRVRYEAQSGIVTEIIATFDNPKFDNGTESEKRELKNKVQELMNEMQDKGAPPNEIVGDLPPELESLPGMNEENCSIM
ncbi:Pex19-domain-containing protein [Acaromyces ingoldii]|uniref:Pex19-domain-containing protein n=1 Tax=Acaromyces ingoldii TaxID=215250 RepID=A0A316YS23_9BASI|nr:Pex19-domain-containing protein [Acaromyces ingoldii]PWN91922.1 Pex19-domain-containing protein [Acaromyces ingoldii]